MNKHYLTDDELAIIRLYRQCDEALFTKHRLARDEAVEFASLVGQPQRVVNEGGKAVWYSASNGKISAAGFIGGGETNE